MFVHDAVCEVIQCGDTEVPASRLGTVVETMAHTLPGDTTTGFQQQFQVSSVLTVHNGIFLSRSMPTDYSGMRTLRIESVNAHIFHA